MDKFVQRKTLALKRTRVDFNLDDLENDPGLRPRISSYHPNDQDTIQRYYLQKGPCQPRGHDFPKTEDRRHFNENWFDEFPSWLEYSISKNAAFCLNCYLFGKGSGEDTFSDKGFINWKRKDKLKIHVGGYNSEHNKAYMKGQNLLKQKQSIQSFISKQSDKVRTDNLIRLTASIHCVRLLLRQGLAFRGHDESETSSNQGNFLAILQHTADHNESINDVVLGNAPENNKLIAPSIQKDIVNVAAIETTHMILKELKGKSSVVNVVGSSCRRRDILREKQVAKIIEALQKGELQTGQGLNQETSLKRPGDTRWGSHYGTLINLTLMFSSVIHVLEVVKIDGYAREQRGQASALLNSIQSFDFVLNMHLMKHSLGITSVLSKALQRKDQDLVNTMNLVSISKSKLQAFRDNGWDALFMEVSSFCEKHDIPIPNMEEHFIARGRSRRGAEIITNLHHYRVGLLYTCIDWQLQELDNRFNEVNTEMLINLSCLSPRDSFSTFDIEKLVRFATFYPMDFSEMDLVILRDQLETYLWDVSSDLEFSELDGISDLAKKMVETKRDDVYPLVFLLIKLALILPVATATVERLFLICIL